MRSTAVPKRRPMDNMKAGWDRPQEDEFGLCMMGQPSPETALAAHLAERPVAELSEHALVNLLRGSERERALDAVVLLDDLAQPIHVSVSQILHAKARVHAGRHQIFVPISGSVVAEVRGSSRPRGRVAGR